MKQLDTNLEFNTNNNNYRHIDFSIVISHVGISITLETKRMSGSEFCNVTILYTEEDALWCDYVVGKFKSDQLNLKIETLNVASLECDSSSEIRTIMNESYVVVMLTTCYFLEYMEMHYQWLAPLVDSRNENITTLVAARLDITPEDLQQSTDKYNYNQHKRWEMMEINVDGSNIKQCISDILGFSDRNAQTLRKSLTKRANSYPSKRCHSDAGELIEIIPNTVQQEGEKVALIFTKEKVKGSVTVSAGDINIPVETVNPYCVTFKAPAIRGTKIYINVAVNNIKLPRQKLCSSRPTPQFSSVELMCQSYGMSNKEELDIMLAEKFTSTICDDSYAMMIFSDIVNNTPTGRSHSRYPTLLHWAAANELRELCSALLSAPGANEACNISNCDDDDVTDLAQKNGHVDLANFIMEFTETKQMADVCDLYVKSYKSSYKSPTEADSLYEVMIPTTYGRPTGPPIVPRTPPADKGLPLSSPPNSLPEEDDNYIIPDGFRLPTPQEFLSAKIKQHLPLGAIGSRSQTELIEIQEEVKKGNFSIREAEMLFSSWKARYETGNAISFKEKQQSLQSLRQQNKKAMDLLKTSKNKKKEKGNKKSPGVCELVNNISEPIGMRQKTGANMFPGPGRGDSGISTDRANHDSGRYSARDSTLSNTSTSSDEVEFECGSHVMRANRSQSEKSSGRLNDYRQSTRDLYLELTHTTAELPEAGPPPLPPRLNRNPAAEAVKQPPRVAAKPSFSKMPKQPVPSKNSTVYSK